MKTLNGDGNTVFVLNDWFSRQSVSQIISDPNNFRKPQSESRLNLSEEVSFPYFNWVQNQLLKLESVSDIGSIRILFFPFSYQLDLHLLALCAGC